MNPRRATLITFVVFSLSVVGYLMWRETREEFPTLAEGAYIGEISGVIETTPVPFFVEQFPKKSDLFVVVLSEGWKPQMGQLSPSDSKPKLPLIITSGVHRLKFVGRKWSDDTYHGEVVDLSNDQKGQWSMSRAPQPKEIPDTTSMERLLLKQKLKFADYKADALMKIIPDQKLEVEKLGRFLSNEAAIKQNADKKFEVEKNKLSSVEKEYSDLKSKLENVHSQYLLALHLTPQGRLIALARETLVRDASWLTARLESETQGVLTPELQEKAQKMQRIAHMKADLESEKKRMVTIQSQGEIQ